MLFMPNKLSFIIINYKTPEITSECVKSIQKHINIDYEIIVVDNHSQDNSKDYILSKSKETKWISLDNNFGYGYAVNRGFDVSNGNYIIVLNSDIIIMDDFSKDLISRYESQETGCLGIELKKLDGKRQDTASSFPTLMTLFANELKPLRKIKKFRRYTQSFQNDNNIYKVDWVTGAFLFISAERFKEISGFDESFFMFYEDIDFCRKLTDKGYFNYYLTDYSALHKHNYSVKKNKIDEYNLYQLAEKKSAIYYAKKYFKNKMKLFMILYYLIFLYKYLKNLVFLAILFAIKRKRKKIRYKLRTYSRILSLIGENNA